MSREDIISAAMEKAEEMTRLFGKPKPTVGEWAVAQKYVRQSMEFLVRSALSDSGGEIVTRADLSEGE
jgi:hypothetical protein